jgi:UDP-GlcNAc:undecaprenyl-phosphate/decaprenyl-phosphate GlcNAc-1-phosphate transferase
VELFALGTLVLAALIAWAVTPLVRRVAVRRGFVDRPGERKIHSREIAYGGGLAVALAFAVAALAAHVLAFKNIHGEAFLLDVEPHTLATIAACALGALLLGLADDRYKLSVRAKLLGQLVLAIATVAGGVRITALIGDNLAMQAFTVLWIVLITNSFNLLDNMDGLCSGTVSISALMLMLVALQSNQGSLVLVLAALGGACLGFLYYNRAPASIFLGDAGSLFCGYIMAALTALVTYYRYTFPSHLAVGIPLLILAIPLYDTLSVIVIRLREGRPITRGDTSHFSHRLTDLGMSRREAVTTIHLACLAIGLPATVLGKLPPESGFLILGQALLVLTIVALLERASRRKNRESAVLKPVGDARDVSAKPEESPAQTRVTATRVPGEDPPA